MNPAIAAMMAKYPCKSQEDRIQALREIFQEIALLGLWRGKFFEHAAFYGGTALRVFHGLNRFSEDIDFSLLRHQPTFSLAPYCSFIEDELKGFGFTATVQARQKPRSSQIESAFLKADTLKQLLVIEPATTSANTQWMPALRIKLEVDTTPPLFFQTEVLVLLNPIPFGVRIFSPSSMFAGKMHALLCRNWKNRVKGRDWYDFVWFIGRGVPLHLGHLQERMRQTGHLHEGQLLSPAMLVAMLKQRIDSIDFEQAKRDVVRFLLSKDTIALWAKSFFHEVARKLVIEQNGGG